eukprot:TRINITY_DN1372_c0_g1_i1.p1 TRINITY_DN1372_c0_g1~~TRINITY_DN1372_c0_g1_i1.p1  ORF type:complete len:185 (-),score=33.05 TRINITY_DN1372_c0_g1_i1:222-776(-)
MPAEPITPTPPTLKPPKQKKLLLLGGRGVGKTSLMIRVGTGQFPTPSDEYYLPKESAPIKDKTVNLEGLGYQISLWDTRGSGGRRRIPSKVTRTSYPETDICLLCFSVDSMISFEAIETGWSEEIQNLLPHAQILLVGLKSELRTNVTNAEKKIEGEEQVEEPEFVEREMGVKAWINCLVVLSN